MNDLKQVITDARGDAAVLRSTGNVGQAEYIERLCDRIKDVGEDFMRWLSEENAMLRSGWSDRTMRRRFAELADCGLARWNEGKREFLAIGVPQRADIDEARQRGAKVVTR